MSGSGTDTLARRQIRPALPEAGLRVLVVTESFLPQVNGVTKSVAAGWVVHAPGRHLAGRKAPVVTTR